MNLPASPDGRAIVSASWDRTVRIWDVGTGSQLHVLEGHADAVHWVAFSPDGALLLTTSSDGTARIWGAPGGARSGI